MSSVGCTAEAQWKNGDISHQSQSRTGGARADVGAAGECLKNFLDSELRVGVNTAQKRDEPHYRTGGKNAGGWLPTARKYGSGE
jgi:hypothetical protein